MTTNSIYNKNYEPQQLSVGYIQECELFERTGAVNNGTTFTTGITESTIQFSSANLANFVAEQILLAQDVQDQEELHGLPVTPFVLVTDINTTYEFEPNGFVSVDGNTITIDTASVIAWPADGLVEIASTAYSLFSACECVPVEIMQEIDDAGDVYLLKIVDTSRSDTVTGLKFEYELPLDFGVTGPFIGQCPTDEQVVELDELCCNDDLVNNSANVANQRLVWADGSDTSTLFNNGVVITGNPGDTVDEIQDKINPGVSQSIITQAGSTDPQVSATTVNDLNLLEFDGVNDVMALNLGNKPANQPFTLFYLVSTSDTTTISASIVAVGPSTGGAFSAATGAWQLSRDVSSNRLILRGTAGPNSTNPWFNVLTENIPCPDCISQAEIAFLNWIPFANGDLHLVTVNYDGQYMTGYIDGSLSFIVEPFVTVDVQGEYFRFGSNRIGNENMAMDMAEVFISDGALSEDEIATVNAYLICKWGIDPSLAAGGAGELTLAADGAYNGPTPFVRLRKASGTETYVDTSTGQEFSLPPVPGLSLCESSNVNGDTFDVEPICMVDSSRTVFYRRAIYSVSDGSLVSTVDTEEDMVTVYNPVGALRPCSREDQVGTDRYTPTITNTTGVYATIAGRSSVSITNISGDGSPITIDGVSIPDGIAVKVNGYFDEFTRDWNKIDTMTVDATGGRALIVELH